jgi:hypothetical protein
MSPLAVLAPQSRLGNFVSLAAKQDAVQVVPLLQIEKFVGLAVLKVLSLAD